MRSKTTCWCFSVVALVLYLSVSTVQAATLQASVQDAKSQPLKDAVVYAIPQGGSQAKRGRGTRVTIDQRNKEFIPYVMAINVGTAVDFPNYEQIRHQVYSFSPVKTFEIPLYKGKPAQPIVFNKPGVVTLGCNIHDWMSAYLFVSETPYFAVTGADGKVAIKGVPAGTYTVRVWHPTQADPPEESGRKVGLKGKSSLSFSVRQKPVWRPWRAPSASPRGY